MLSKYGSPSSHEIEIIQSIRVTCEALSKKQARISHGDLMSAVGRRNPAKVSPNTLLTLSKYFIGFLENAAVDLVDDLEDFHPPMQLTPKSSL